VVDILQYPSSRPLTKLARDIVGNCPEKDLLTLPTANRECVACSHINMQLNTYWGYEADSIRGIAAIDIFGCQ
jgi:hypothetical protein